MTKKGSPDDEKGMTETPSLKNENQLLNELRVRLADIEKENRELKNELKALRFQNDKVSPSDAAQFPGVDRRKKPSQSISPDKGLLRCIIDSVGDLIYVKDKDSIYRGCNKASERFVGLKESEQIGKTDFDFFDQELAEKVQIADRQILTSGQEQRVEEWVPAPDGSRMLLETTKTPFYGPDGQAAGIVGISRDITARKQAEDDLKKANNELDAFARTVSHDLRTPLIPIIGYAEILRKKYQGPLDETALEYLDEIISSGNEMLMLMKDLLALATAGYVERPAIPINTGQVAKTVVSDLAEQLSQAGVSVQVGNLPSIRVPKTLLFLVFNNLILNAVKYGSKAGDIIEVGGDRCANRVNLYVRDYGPGIPVCERDRIFESFYRGTTNKEVQGTGIGLATVQKIAGLFDGNAGVSDTPGGGSTFWMKILDVPVSNTEK